MAVSKKAPAKKTTTKKPVKKASKATTKKNATKKSTAKASKKTAIRPPIIDYIGGLRSS